MEKENNKLLHKTLIRQLRHYYPDQAITPELEKLLSIISETYHQAERDRHLLERAMQISSVELAEANQKAQQELENKLITENILKEKDKILNSINENVSEAVYRSTPKKGIIFANKAFLELFGFESEEEVLYTASDNFYADPEVRSYLQNILKQTGIIQAEEVLYRRKDGSTFWGLNTARMIDYDGEIYYDGAIINITHQKNNEEKLKEANQELKKINRELDSFVYSIGHDLRAPIASTLGLISLSKEENKIETLQMYNELKEKSLLKLDAFIQDILGYSRNARLELEFTPVEVLGELESMREMLASSSDMKDINLTFNIDTKADFYTDKYRFNLIFSNLISNAYRYHNAQIPNKFIHIEAHIDTQHAIFTIADNGQGIDALHLDKIFNMFYRANKSAKGSGLGLYIVKEAVAKLSGEISVKSELGKGTTFTVKVPNNINYHLPSSIENDLFQDVSE